MYTEIHESDYSDMVAFPFPLLWTCDWLLRWTIYIGVIGVDWSFMLAIGYNAKCLNR